jgi:hypothetical protein
MIYELIANCIPSEVILRVRARGTIRTELLC